MKSSKLLYFFNAFVALGIASLCFAYVGKREFGTMIFLPGTQPGQADTAESYRDCAPCHQEQVQQWSGSMMAHAPKDPLFNAMLSITEKYMMPLGLDVGEYCLRCHSPSGWLAGRSHPQTVQDMYGTDLDGVHCDACHRMTNPMANDGSAIIGDTVPGIGNGMYAVQHLQRPLRGKRGSPHVYGTVTADSFFTTSEFCGVCHEVSNPYLSPNARKTPPHLQKLMERTYSEWKLSWYAERGESGTCQSCHMKKSPGKASSMVGTRERLDVASHAFSGGNTFGPRSVLNNWSGVNADAIRSGVETAKTIAREAIRLELSAGKVSGEEVKARVRVTNLTGHKLPTGFPEGRRVWIQITGRDHAGNIVFQSGAYDSAGHSLPHDDQLKMYHTEPGISPAVAEYAGVSPGPSYITPLNDTVYYDNRIPPRGFQYAAFAERKAEPVGYHYDDGQYWDETDYSLPAGTTEVEAGVWYQVASPEFIEFARSENSGNPYDWNSWGEKVYQDWLLYGQPIEMGRTKISVSGSFSALPPHTDVEKPVTARMAQNYPNPFNPSTKIEFWLSEPSFVNLSVYDISGKKIAEIVNSELAGGSHFAYLNSLNLSSGTYLYMLKTKNSAIIKKMIVLK